MRVIVFPLAELARLPYPNDPNNKAFASYFNGRIGRRRSITFDSTKIYMCTDDGMMHLAADLTSTVDTYVLKQFPMGENYEHKAFSAQDVYVGEIQAERSKAIERLVRALQDYAKKNQDHSHWYLIIIDYGENDVTEENEELLLANIMKYENIPSIIKQDQNDQQDQNDLALSSKKQFIFTGAPGTGKTYRVRSHFEQGLETDTLKKTVKFIQFHSSYDYTDLIEGLRPVVIDYDDGKPITQFVRLDGTFKEFCRTAARDEGQGLKYAFIIDEINRADLSRVFGEIMFCLEESYRGEDNRIATQYQNLPTYYKTIDDEGRAVFKPYAPGEDIFEDGFYIPENVYIIGTMNDIDRSVETFDFALRRRFEWINVKAADTMVSALENRFEISDDNDPRKERFDALIRHITSLNKYIADAELMRLNEDYQLGQSYFAEFPIDKLQVDPDQDKVDPDQDKVDPDQNKKVKVFEDYFEKKLRSILFEYVRGQSKKKCDDFLDNCKKAFSGEEETETDGGGKNS